MSYLQEKIDKGKEVGETHNELKLKIECTDKFVQERDNKGKEIDETHTELKLKIECTDTFVQENNNKDEKIGETYNELKRKFECTDEFQERKVKISRSDVRSGFTESTFAEAEYYFENGLRKVYPYFFTYTTFCKGRWVGRKLIDVFSGEFRAHSKQECEKNVENGNIKVNDKVIGLDCVLKENDQITNRVHRHEQAILAAPIKIIHLSEELVVIDKPPSIPVHPCGRYRHNSILFILAKEHNLKDLHTVHRLDRLTSGVLLFTRTIKRSQEIDEQIRERKMEKEYVCRVEGLFPDGIICCNEPIEVVSPKMGVSVVSSTGKDCKTEFEKLSFNGKSSVVRCKPFTGRMHQIRVHLQYLGHPILNDPIYNHASVFGPQKGKNGITGKSRDQLLLDLFKTHNFEKWSLSGTKKDNIVQESVVIENRMAQNALTFYTESIETLKLANQYVKKHDKIIIDPTCDMCHQKYMDPEPKDLILFLHALKYKGNGFEFKSELPAWAMKDWNEM